MNPPSTRIRKRRAPQRQLPDPHQTLSVLRRRSSRIQSRQRSVSKPHILRSYYESQSPLEQRPTNPQTSQSVGATSYTGVPTSSPIEVSVPVPSRAQFQEYLCQPETHNYQTRKRRPDRSIETGADRPQKRARLTERNLKAFEKMGGRARKSAGKKSTGQSSSTTTTTDKDFGPQLQRNNVVFTSIDARAPDDTDEVRELLDQPRESEPPDRLDYNEYLVATEGLNNESTIQTAVYPLLSKRTSREARISGYGQRANYTWSEVDNHLTMGLSDAKPDIFESYRKTDYPPEAVDALSSALAPTSYDIAMPAFAVEVKGCEGSMQAAHLQCAYDGALMTEGARAVHKHTGKSDDDFYGKTQALTVAFNGETLKFYGHHAGQIPASSQPAASDAVDTLQYHQYLYTGDTPRDSFENFQSAYKHTRNAQDFGYQLATERKDALWAHANADNTQTSHDVDDRRDVEDEPSSQLLAEYYTSFTEDNQDERFMQIPPADNGCTSGDAPTYTPITPPQSSKDVSLPLESQQPSVSAVTEPREDVDSSAHGHRTTRRARTRAADTVEGPREVDHKSKARKTRRKH